MYAAARPGASAAVGAEQRRVEDDGGAQGLRALAVGVVEVELDVVARDGGEGAGGEAAVGRGVGDDAGALRTVEGVEADVGVARRGLALHDDGPGRAGAGLERKAGQERRRQWHRWRGAGEAAAERQ